MTRTEAKSPAGALHLIVLASFAIAQPLLDLLGGNAEFFVARHSEPAELVSFALALAVGLPSLLALGVEVVRRVSPRTGRTLHLGMIASLALLIALPALKRTPLPATADVSAAAVIGVAAAVAYARLAAVRTFVTLLAPAPLVFVVMFLAGSRVSRLVAAPEPHVVHGATVAQEARPVVFVIFDELPLISLLDRKLEIDGRRYPRFAELARRASWYRNATSVADSTTKGVPAILTGRYPVEDRLPTFSEYPENLFTLMPAGARVSVTEPVTRMCPDTVCESSDPERRSFAAGMRSLVGDATIVWLHVVLPAELSRGLPSIDQNWGGFGGGGPAGDRQDGQEPLRRAGRRKNTPRPGRDPVGAARRAAKRQEMSQEQRLQLRAERRDFKRLRDVGAALDRKAEFRRFLGRLSPEKPAALSFLHVLLPHPPFVYLPSGRQYDGAVDEGFIHQQDWGSDPYPPALEYQRHLLQLGFVDRLIGDLIDRLDETGLWDRCLLVIVADHGASFRPEGPRRSVTATNRDEIMRVPLFVKAPEQRAGGASDRNVETIDVLPTVTAAIGIDLPWKMDGESLLVPAGRERQIKKIYRVRSAGSLTFPATFVIDPSALDWKLGWFDAGDPQALFGFGPLRSVLGRRAAEALGDGWTRAAVVLGRREWSFADGIEPPSIVRGRLATGEAERSLYLAVAIGGVVRAVTHTYRDRSGPGAFSAIVPDGSFRTGANEIEVLRTGRAVLPGRSRP